MPAYIIADVDVTDPVRYEPYKALAQAAIAQHGGRYLVRGGRSTVMEGDRTPGRLVLLEFPTAEAAKTFYDSPEYRAAREARAGAARMNLVVVEGL